jgi:hypothetical protein
MGIFVKYKLHLEIAIPTWAKCFTPHYDIDAIELKICTEWNYKLRSNITKWSAKCENDTVLIHPIKYSSVAGLKFAQDFLVQHQTIYMNVSQFLS